VSVSEIFASLQGEGVSAGTPSVFVRLQGCAVGCTWCDTKYSWSSAGGRVLALDAIEAEVAKHRLTNVVVTGGEPLEHPGFVPLVARLARGGHRIEVETAGTEPPQRCPVDQWNVSLKLANSGVPEPRRLRPAAIRRFRALPAWFKFVVGEERDVEEVRAIQERYGLSSARILLMPLGMKREEQERLMPLVSAWCLRYGFRLSPRLHVLMWGARRGV
jgi:organic radical activating enzyme